MAATADGYIRINTKINQTGANAGISSLTKSLKSFAAIAAAAFSVKAIISFGTASLAAAAKLTNAMTGLKSIVEGQGKSFSDANTFIQSYISDGLIPATDAVTAYKNLSMRGYSTDQIEQTMISLKNASAFGRSAALSMGEAVSSATEGLRNENSILVDNSGVTKNVSMMWADYAKSIGVGVNSLTKAQKIQAEVTGIMEETRFQMGDAAKLTGTYSGEVQQLSFNFNNLKVAFGNAIIPALQAILPSINAAVTSLTRLFNAWARVSTALFGQAQSQDNIATSASDAARATTDLADATTEAAKAATDAQASFDQLNVISQGDSTSSATTASTGTSSANALSGEIGSGVTVSPAVEAAIQKAKNLFAPLTLINLDNLSGAFDHLKSALAPFTETLFAGLKWFWDNILVPLAAWTIEDLLPAFLDLLSAALGTLNTVITILQPLWQWVWDNFLLPIATWTGGVMVSILERIAGALTNIGGWISEHQTAVTVFLAGFTAFETTKFVLQMGLALVSIIADTTAKIANTLATGANEVSIFSLIAAKVTEAVENLYLIGLYIWDAVVKAASTAAQVAMTVATTAWNVVCAIASAVTWAFGAAVAFLTSPIGLVILAIAALIVIIVLIVKHWDDIKAAAAACWDWIVGVWDAAAGWMNDNVIQPIVGFFSGLWDGIVGIFQGIINWVKDNWKSIVLFIINPFAGVFKYLYDNFAGFRDFVNGVVSAIGGFFGGLWGGIKNGFVNVINMLINGINTMIRGFLSPINALIDGWNVTIGNVTGKIPNISVAIPNIPRLAAGAVIPPNREFIATLGDQKSGRNIEAPEKLIRQIVDEGVNSEALLEKLDSLIQAVRTLDLNVKLYANDREIARSSIRGVKALGFAVANT